MTETKREEHDRLQHKTDELKKQHADLSLDRTPFDQAAHDEHTAKLAQHRRDLEEHKAREE